MILFDSEKEFEDFLCEELDQGHWIVEDEEISGYSSQFNIGPYGIVDLVLYSDIADVSKDGKPITIGKNITVVELKNQELHHSHLSQIARYKMFFDQLESYYNINYVLVCKKSNLHNGDLVFLAQSLGWLTVYEFDFSLKGGIRFTGINGWYVDCCKEILDQKMVSLEDLVGRIDV